MKTADLVVRCFAEQSEGQWSVVCLDFSLASQDESLDVAVLGLKAQIKDYIEDALNGPDSEYASDLIWRRSAPLGMWARYYWIKLTSRFSNWFSGPRGPRFKLFNQALPLTPAAT